MSEPDDITDRPPDSPRRGDFTDEPRGDEGAYEPPRPEPAPKGNKTALIVVLVLGGVVMLFGCLLAIGLLIPSVAKVRVAADRVQSQNNLHQIGIAMHSASDSMNGALPPSNGPYSNRSGSFFYHILPYVEQANLYNSVPPGDVNAAPVEAPVRTYVAPADKRNPGTNGTISYCTNGTVFMNSPHMPGSFQSHAAANVICVMERSGMDGAHKWNNTNNVLGSPGSPPPFPQLGADPPAYQEGSPHAFDGNNCAVMLGDGSVRTFTKGHQRAWAWGCDPADPQTNPPPDW
jgi:hypothetical protein